MNEFGVPENSFKGEEYIAILQFDAWLVYLAWVAFLILAILLIRKAVLYFLSKTSYFEHDVFLVRLPKEKPGEDKQEMDVQHVREEISQAETIFSSIGGLRAQRGVIAWFLGRNDHFTFEIVANEKKIAFYATSPKKMSQYLEKQIHAYYPDAVIEKVEDYNIFNPKGETVGGFLKTRRHFIFPIKTYNTLDSDGMNSIINVMSKLSSEEGVAVQYVVRSAKGSWHRKISKVAREVRKGKSINDALHFNISGKILSFMNGLAKSAKAPGQKEDLDERNQLTQFEEEMMKTIEEKNAKSGLDVNLRIVVSAQDKGQAQMYLDNISSAFQQFNYHQYGNSFKQRASIRNQRKVINDFIYRRFYEGGKFLLNTEELATLFHFPLREAETPNILWLKAKQAPAPNDSPEEGIILGTNVFRGQEKKIRILREDRRRHMYVVGKSGGGKSVFIANMAIQDILNGDGVCVLDPHGDLIEDILSRVPPERSEDVILFRPADIERPMALNLIEYDKNYPEQKTFVINEMINIFDKLYDLKSTGGPIFEQYMRNALLLIMADPESGSTLMEVPKVLADAEFRNMKLERCKDQTIVDFWRKEAEKAGGDAALANVVPYITSKLTQFISNDTMRPIIGQQKSSFNFREVMDKQKILLVDLSKGAIGEMNAYLLGMILVGKILMSALSRADMKKEDRKDFYLYIDEFQNFTTDSISAILSEARKYGLSLIIAHQYIGQLVSNQDTTIKDSVFGNVGTWVLFKIGSEDAEELEKEFSPTFNQYDLINIEAFTTYVKLLINNTASKPFSMKTPWPLPGEERQELAEKIKTLSRLKYGQDRNIIEAEIARRTRSF